MVPLPSTSTVDSAVMGAASAACRQQANGSASTATSSGKSAGTRCSCDSCATRLSLHPPPVS